NFIGGNITASKPNPVSSPLVMWESVSDFNSKDTILYLAEKDFAPGDEICVKSARNRYPIWITNTKSDTLHRDDTLYVHDIITSRLFLGGGPYKIAPSHTGGVGAPVFMSLTALNYNVNQTWNCVFRTNDTTEQVMDMVVSNDGDHLFILTQKVLELSSEYSLYRVSGFDQYRDEVELDVRKSIYDATAGFYDANDRRMLIDDTLIANLTGEDILSITLDPQNNNNLIYTTNNTGGANPRIKMITNALTATRSTVVTQDKEGNGIPTDMPVYTALIEMTHDNIAYVGTEKGVYITEDLTSANPTWKLYNNGIDINVPVFQLIQQTKNFASTYSVTHDKISGLIDTLNYNGVFNYGIIYAATHGAGIFRDTSYWQKTGSKTFIPGNKYVNNTLKVYPNPANTHFTIDYALPSSNDRVQLNVVDITGKIVYTKNLGVKDAGNHSERLDCSNLPSGFYFVNMIIGRHNKTAKIIISK
ncbi:MAG: T9SS type A sorting domain-containing protein, partial [Bacteroidales bacterium]|nr:T9SS type A sorting domain-containing protein [Bacteroidales bacterium]